MRLAFFEKVVIQNSRKFPELNGRSGVVLAVSEEDGHVFGYAVSVEGEEEGYDFAADEIAGTGELVDRGVFYDDNDQIRVRVSADGYGEIVIPEDN